MCSSNTQAYVLALRPWTYAQSVFPAALGASIAYADMHEVQLLAVVLSLLIVLSVHSAGNLVNTYDDYIRGVDDSDSADDRTLVDSRLTALTVQYMGTGFYIVGLLLFGCLCLISRTSPLLLSFMFFGGLSGSFLYTREPAVLKHIGWGDLVVVITFGPLTTLFTYLSTGGAIYAVRWLEVVVLALPMAFLTEAVLHSKHTRDGERNRKQKPATLASLLNRGWSHIWYCLMIFVPYGFLTVLSVWYSVLFCLPFVTLPHAFTIEKDFRFGRMRSVPQQTGKLGAIFSLLYVPVFLYVSV
ncbi:ubiA prenyltransferase domain-containing protein 1-like [Sycon ciliatum]|uniref:ubiA prenyltransferase domain-containing protein 1-like n=1 Tax=Sycon ciliatum TaxID=27933 RepID=UPI0020A928B1|eukprot:scpid91954/ scgid34367/ UbiA prenyltransferase domain-containing protein 1 homolog; Protein heix